MAFSKKDSLLIYVQVSKLHTYKHSSQVYGRHLTCPERHIIFVRSITLASALFFFLFRLFHCICVCARHSQSATPFTIGSASLNPPFLLLESVTKQVDCELPLIPNLQLLCNELLSNAFRALFPFSKIYLKVYIVICSLICCRFGH